MNTTIKQIKLHICFFPFLAHGHLLPTVDMAKLFASRGCKTTLILTRGNAPLFAKTIQRSQDLGHEIEALVVEFPAEEAGIPKGLENAQQITEPEMIGKFFSATMLLERPVEKILSQLRPDCLIAGGFFPWASGVAARLNIPRIVFHGTCFFSLCVNSILLNHRPQDKVSNDTEPFVVPNLPDEITFVRDQISHQLREESEWSDFAKKVEETEITSYGVVVNSFFELEPGYADNYRNVLGRKAWHIGPVSLINREREDKAHRGPESAIEESDCVNWLNSKKPGSVIYVSFGTVSNFSDSQLREIAIGLENSEKEFIWVVKKNKKQESVKEDWLPEGFEERIGERGLIIRGWAPQVSLLAHEATGGFVTHCGWNSVMEGICAGLPMVAWPVASEQFYNEKLVTEILGVGVGVGARKWVRFEGDRIESLAVERAVRRITEGDEAPGMRIKARALAEKAARAFAKDGSSYLDMESLIEELRLLRTTA